MDLSILINLVHFQIEECLVYFFVFIPFQIENPVSKQWRPWPDVAFRGVWSGSALSAKVPKWDAGH